MGRIPVVRVLVAESGLQAELGAAPVAALGVVADRVVSAETDPVRDGAVLTRLLGKLLLNTECLLGRHLLSAATPACCFTLTGGPEIKNYFQGDKNTIYYSDFRRSEFRKFKRAPQSLLEG